MYESKTRTSSLAQIGSILGSLDQRLYPVDVEGRYLEPFDIFVGIEFKSTSLSFTRVGCVGSRRHLNRDIDVTLFVPMMCSNLHISPVSTIPTSPNFPISGLSSSISVPQICHLREECSYECSYGEIAFGPLGPRSTSAALYTQISKT